MSEQAHTPGPWVVDDETAAPTIWAGMAPSGHGNPGRLVARALGDDAQVEGNARLIAAAPALYEALEALVEEVCDYALINNLGDPEAKHNIKRARAALSRTEG